MFLNSFANLLQPVTKGMLCRVVAGGLDRANDLAAPIISAKPTHLWLAEEAPAPGNLTPILIGCGLLFLAVVVGVLVWKGKSKPKTRESRSESPAKSAEDSKAESPSSALPSLVSNRPNLIKAQNQGQIAKTKPPVSTSAWKKPVLTDRASGGSAKESSSRKRAFDYNRYFADLMSTVEGHTGSAESGNAGGYQSDTSQITSAQAASEAGTLPPGAAAQADLIASQASLIEEQRRMIQEQSKLIEEKNRIIAEKDRQLRRQSTPAEQQV